jgi:thiol:disulfide interchange protein
MNTPQKIVGALTISLATVIFANHESEFELLDPEVAFNASATAIDAQTLQIDFVIADGYYMYHDKFRFSSTTAGITLGDPQIPPGKVKIDEFFGEVETHRNAISIRVPYTAQADAASSLTLQAASQGCADIGVCYPPLKQNLTVSLAGFTGAQANDEIDQTLLKHFTVFGPPAILFFDKKGWEIANSRVVGFIDADKFAAHINSTFTN